eukprot:tig00000492_g1562.t1
MNRLTSLTPSPALALDWVQGPVQTKWLRDGFTHMTDHCSPPGERCLAERLEWMATQAIKAIPSRIVETLGRPGHLEPFRILSLSTGKGFVEAYLVHRLKAFIPWIRLVTVDRFWPDMLVDFMRQQGPRYTHKHYHTMAEMVEGESLLKNSICTNFHLVLSIQQQFSDGPGSVFDLKDRLIRPEGPVVDTTTPGDIAQAMKAGLMAGLGNVFSEEGDSLASRYGYPDEHFWAMPAPRQPGAGSLARLYSDWQDNLERVMLDLQKRGALRFLEDDILDALEELSRPHLPPGFWEFRG